MEKKSPGFFGDSVLVRSFVTLQLDSSLERKQLINKLQILKYYSSSFCLLLHLYTWEDFGLSIDAEESIKSIKPCKILSISIQLHTAEDSLRTVAKESSL